MADFREAFKLTLAHEGGYVKDPDDRGGETYKGIARRYNPGWSGWVRIDKAKKRCGFPKTLKADQALQTEVAVFYRSHYWDKFQGTAFPCRLSPMSCSTQRSTWALCVPSNSSSAR